jgi:hypothetical protein
MPEMFVIKVETNFVPYSKGIVTDGVGFVTLFAGRWRLTLTITEYSNEF